MVGQWYIRFDTCFGTLYLHLRTQCMLSQQEIKNMHVLLFLCSSGISR